GPCLHATSETARAQPFERADEWVRRASGWDDGSAWWPTRPVERSEDSHHHASPAVSRATSRPSWRTAPRTNQSAVTIITATKTHMRPFSRYLFAPGLPAAVRPA